VTGVVVWFTGRPSSGKSTLAAAVREVLEQRHTPTLMLDSDAVRALLRPEPGYDAAARDAFYATLANLAALLAGQGFVVLVPATAHLRHFRDRARDVARAFLEVYVDVSATEAERRDAKGLYAAVRQGKLRGVPGADVEYEVPEHPDVTSTGRDDREALARLLELIETKRRGQS
jgi:adenylylsulfate kinase